MASLKGNFSTSNETSADNPLANATRRYTNTTQPSNTSSRITNNPNPGGLVKSNVSSSDNPFSNYRSYDANPQMTANHTEPWRKINTYARPTSGTYFPPEVPDSRLPKQQMQDANNNNGGGGGGSRQYLPAIGDSSAYDRAHVPYVSESGLFYPSQSNSSGQHQPTYSYNEEPTYTNVSGGGGVVPLPPPQRYQMQPTSSSGVMSNSTYSNNNSDNNNNFNSNDLTSKLEKQAQDRELNRFLDEKNRKINDPHNYYQGSLIEASHHPLIGSKMLTNGPLPYHPGYDGGGSPTSLPRLNKDIIVEKPNSLSADLPPYDPIKDRSGYTTGYNYNPWGKPGGGAPLIDPNTGRKYTKKSGQVWYDTIGMSPDDRAKVVLDRNRPLTLEEQKYEMEMEKERRRYEDASYRARAGDVATWITDIESQRQKHAHLPHTSVTRDKINVEFARRQQLDQSTKLYHEELQLQIEERNRENKLQDLQDNIANIEHVKRWDDWWGKPGGGAPNIERRRHNLEEKLEQPTDSVGIAKSLPLGNDGRRFNNSNANLVYTNSNSSSNHKNLYDNLMPMK